MSDQVIVVRACPLCCEANALVTVGRDFDSRGELRREWVIDVDCANETRATHADPTKQ